jgi:hypothetical protein
VAALKFCLDGRAATSLRNEADKLNRVMQHGRHAGIVPLRQVYLKADPSASDGTDDDATTEPGEPWPGTITTRRAAIPPSLPRPASCAGR